MQGSRDLPGSLILVSSFQKWSPRCLCDLCVVFTSNIFEHIDETSAAFVAVLPARLQLVTLKQRLRRDPTLIYAFLSDLFLNGFSRFFWPLIFEWISSSFVCWNRRLLFATQSSRHPQTLAKLLGWINWINSCITSGHFQDQEPEVRCQSSDLILALWDQGFSVPGYCDLYVGKVGTYCYPRQLWASVEGTRTHRNFTRARGVILKFF